MGPGRLGSTKPAMVRASALPEGVTEPIASGFSIQERQVLQRHGDYRYEIIAFVATNRRRHATGKGAGPKGQAQIRSGQAKIRPSPRDRRETPLPYRRIRRIQGGCPWTRASRIR